MRINFKKLHPKAVLPSKAHKSDYAFDCVAVTEEEIAPNVWRYGLGFAAQIDAIDKYEEERYKIAVYARSSIYKTGMILSNGVASWMKVIQGRFLLSSIMSYLLCQDTGLVIGCARLPWRIVGQTNVRKRVR